MKTDKSSLIKNTRDQCSYHLPDGSEISLGKERYEPPEIMFDPSIIGREVPAIHEMVHNVLQKSDLELRKHLHKDILLTGGNTKFNGFEDRFLSELSAISPKDVKVSQVLTFSLV